MLTFLIYELKVAAILAAFYLCFKCFLSREKMHRTNRIVLVLTSILSFILPLCIVTIHMNVMIPEQSMEHIVNGTVIQTSEAIMEHKDVFPWVLLVESIYWIGVSLVLSGIFIGIARVIKVIKHGEKRMKNGVEVRVSDNKISPFSWMKWIVLSKDDFESGNQYIIQHETAHIELGHSIEVLLFDMMSAFQWFNPAMWLMKRDLRAIHEYEADDAVLSSGADIKDYQYSLIRKAVCTSGYSIANNFNKSIIKNRITMMSKEKASRMRLLKAIYVLPLVCIVLALNANCSSSTSPEMVDLGLSVKWATCNLNAEKPEDTGSFFSWGDVKGQTWDGSQWSESGFWENNVPSYEIDGQGNLKPEYDAAHKILGGSWRMPTKTEIQELIDNCVCTKTNDYNGTGVAGMIFTSKKAGYTDKSIFIPATGYGLTSMLQESNSFFGINWSCSFNEGKAWTLSFDTNDLEASEFERIVGFTIRPVSK